MWFTTNRSGEWGVENALIQETWKPLKVHEYARENAWERIGKSVPLASLFFFSSFFDSYIGTYIVVLTLALGVRYDTQVMEVETMGRKCLKFGIQEIL